MKNRNPHPVAPSRRFGSGVGFSSKHRRETLGVSWWAAHAQPGQRESFRLAAQQRQIERTDGFVAGYANADGRLDK